MPDARVVDAGLHLLDRQLVDRQGRLCGKVDDLELTEAEGAGAIYVNAILSGSGALLMRTGHLRLGQWLRRFTAAASTAESDVPVRIPIARVSDIGDHITLSLDKEELGTFAGERWVRDHIIGHIPGNRHNASG